MHFSVLACGKRGPSVRREVLAYRNHFRYWSRERLRRHPCCQRRSNRAALGHKIRRWTNVSDSHGAPRACSRFGPRRPALSRIRTRVMHADKNGIDAPPMHRITPLLGAHPYIRLFRGKTFVIKVSGSILADPGARANLAEDVALLHHVGIRVALVHGGGPQLDGLCKQLDVPREVVAGRRVTDAKTLELARMVFRGSLNSDLVSALAGQGVKAVGLSGGDGGSVVGHRRPPRTMRDPSTGVETAVDFGFVGDIDTVDAALPGMLLNAGMVPVYCSLIADANGGLLNTNADTIAARVAMALGAEKLLLCTSVPGLLEDPNDARRLVSYGDLGTVEELIRQGAVSGGMLPKLAAVGDALRGGVPRVHIIDGTRPHALLLEVFTNEGCGTMLVLRREDG